METAKYYHCQPDYEDGFILTVEGLEDLKEWYMQNNDGDGGDLEIYYDIFPVFEYAIESGLFINAAGDTVYFCDRSCNDYHINFEGTPEEADEYLAELFRAANYCG